ncbi:MAG: outer rane efflux protein, partial [Myxococcaceae bacterium]|nr:outer rane efflux protein [Myxococcaceae bacterium]
TEAAGATRTEAAVAMIPQIALSARYTRLSPITQPALNFGALSSGSSQPFCVDANGGIVLGSRTAGGALNCPNGAGAIPAAPATGGSSGFSFPVILDNIVFNGTVTVPLTDIPFRLARVYEAAGLTVEARRLDELSARAQAAADARVAFYEYVRASGQVMAAAQALESVQQHRADLARFVEAGTVARVDLLRVEAQVAESERLVLAAREGQSLAQAQLRQRIHAREGERFELGEALDGELPVPGTANQLIDRALQSRPELLSLDRQTHALSANLAATRAGMFPSISGQFSVDVANPNQRFVPQTNDFNTTWSATIQAQWSPTGAFSASAAASRLAAQRAGLTAQLNQLREGTEIEVRSVWISAQTSRAAIESARRQVLSAEESYRVRRERFQAGSAVSSDLTDAELDLLRARLALVNANVDLRESLARLRRAVGEREPD